MLRLFILLACLLGQWLLGLAVARLMLNRRTRPAVDDQPNSSLPELLGLGFVLGIGLNAWFLFLWSLGGGQLGREASLFMVAVGFVCGIPSLIAEIVFLRRCRSRVVVAEQSAFCRVCQWGVGCLTVVALVQSLMTPQRLWDERAYYALKATVLFEDNSIRSPDLAEPDFVQGHPRYPLLLPLAEQHLYALLGGIDDRLAKVYFPLLFAGLVLTTIGVLSRHVSPARAWLWGMLLATAPILLPNDYGFLCAQADAPVACFHGVAVLYLWDIMERARSWKSLSIGAVIVAGLCAGLTAFTKDEGIAFLIVDTAALMLIGLLRICRDARLCRTAATKDVSRSGSELKPLIVSILVYVTCAVIIVIPWLVHRRGLPQTTEMNYFDRLSLPFLMERAGTLAWSVPHLARRMFWEWSEWGLQWWLMLTALVLAPRRACRVAQVLLLLDVIGAVAALLVAGMLAPVLLQDHLDGSSHRFLMQITPVAILFAAGQLGVAREESRKL